jgi:hypothetical protein
VGATKEFPILSLRPVFLTIARTPGFGVRRFFSGPWTLECDSLLCSLHGFCACSRSGDSRARPQALQGPSMSSRRFQPAETVARRIAPTPKGLTCRSAPSGPGRLLGSPLPWVSPTATHCLPLRGKACPDRLSASSPPHQGPCKEQSLLPLSGSVHGWCCHSERSEESLQLLFGFGRTRQTAEILRFAQNDSPLQRAADYGILVRVLWR